MGLYINEMPDGAHLSAKRKADQLLTIEGTKEIEKPTEWQEGIVCVVDNGPFEAAAYAFSEDEMEEFARPDGRKKRWLIVPGAKELAK